MPVWQKTPGRPSHLPVASAQRPRAPVSVSVWKAESWWLSRDSCPNSREPGSVTRSFQLALGKHGHLQAGAPAPAGTPAPETLPIQLSSGGGSCHPPTPAFPRTWQLSLPGVTQIFEEGSFLFSETIDTGAWEGRIVGTRGWDTQEKEGLLMMLSL